MGNCCLCLGYICYSRFLVGLVALKGGVGDMKGFDWLMLQDIKSVKMCTKFVDEKGCGLVDWEKERSHVPSQIYTNGWVYEKSPRKNSVGPKINTALGALNCLAYLSMVKDEFKQNQT